MWQVIITLVAWFLEVVVQCKCEVAVREEYHRAVGRAVVVTKRF